MGSSPLSGDFQSWQRQQPTEWGPLLEEDGGWANDDEAQKFRFTTGVYSNVWETRAASLNIEVMVDSSAPYTPPLPVNPENPRAWITVCAQGRTLGNVEFELKADTCPLAAENFYKLCEAGVYRGTLLHRIIPGCMAQGGDYNIRCDTTVPEEDLFDLDLVEYRRGGRSIYEEVTFGDEDSTLKHVAEGVLSMASEARGVNASQFFVTYGSQEHLDKRFQVFGQVLSGMEVLRAVSVLGTRNGTVVQKVVVEDCGAGALTQPGPAPTSASPPQASSAQLPARSDVATSAVSGRHGAKRYPRTCEPAAIPRGVGGRFLAAPLRMPWAVWRPQSGHPRLAGRARGAMAAAASAR
eukprot:CAMPEP_0117677020 /NCGR_PEP_ID=MMETSP0804-20121206/16521_1 /TAXON_ID=1074897 /ORGANISM="Tetraselmis astigmatica, Strain CCMP880" /LENGTH=351 /DNA_ID=CAMNT_0005486273 /DNA_START=80 /DNA_END=1131 /DNA_ORIENTATION=-